MTELHLLRILLILGTILAPLASHRLLLPSSRCGKWMHGAAVLCTAMGLMTSMPILCVAWLLFCAASFGLHLRRCGAQLRSPFELASCIPFLFSNIAAVWIVGGANGLEILGYGEAFSYYAALHGTYLGWILVGSIALLAKQERPFRRLYLLSAFACLGSFVLIALGIDGLAAIKPYGVLGLSLAIPVAQLAFLQSTWSQNKTAFALGCISLLGLALTMTLAWQNELGTLSSPEALGVRSMVSIHGLINSVVVAPCFMLAVLLERRP